MNPKFAYVLDYFRSVYDVPAHIDIGHGGNDHTVNIQSSETRYFEAYDPYPPTDVVWQSWHDLALPFLFDAGSDKPILEIKSGKAFINYDILASGFFFLSGWQEYVYMLEHKAWRYPYADSLQNHLAILKIPVVNYYFDILRQAIAQSCDVELEARAWGEFDYACCLTHDIDNCQSGWLEGGFDELRNGRIGALPSLIGRRLAGRDIWFNFDEILSIEDRLGANSSFYFLAERGGVYLNKSKLHKRPETGAESDGYTRRHSYFRLKNGWEAHKNSDYDIRNREFAGIFGEIRRRGSEVGVHGSISSHLSADRLRREKETVDPSIVGGRFHYLYFDRTCSFDIAERAGLEYDTTLGFSEETGFRNGIVWPFHPYNIAQDKPHKIVEIPLLIMDVTFRQYKKTLLADVLGEVGDIHRQVRKFAGCLTLLWHNPYFSSFKYGGWRQVYKEIVTEAKQNNAALLSGHQVLQHWQPVLQK